MSRSIQWNVVAYMISAALLASLFFSFNLSTSIWNKRSTDINHSFPQWQHNKLPSITAVPMSAPVLPKSRFQPATVIPKSSTAPIRTAAVSEKIGSPAVASPVHTYKVTSYYLNVRALPNADSDILREVKQGTLLQVSSKTVSGWLALKGGGYVNGRYTLPTKPASSTETLPPVPLQAVPDVRIVPLQAKDAAGRTVIEQVKTSADTRTIAEPAEPVKASAPVKPSSKVMSDSGLTKAHIAVILKNTKLAGLGLEDVILGVEQKYGINAFFTIAVMKLESGNGKSTLSRTKNNLFGLNAITGDAHRKAFSFATKGDSIRKFGQLINDKYVERGYTTIEKVARKYCPANGLWAGHVRTIMRSDYGKLA